MGYYTVGATDIPRRGRINPSARGNAPGQFRQYDAAQKGRNPDHILPRQAECKARTYRLVGSFFLIEWSWSEISSPKYKEQACRTKV